MSKFISVCALPLFPAAMVMASGLDSSHLPLLTQTPSLSRTHIAFTFAGEIWTVPREGGEARRLVSGLGMAMGPVFSPAGTQLAFTATVDGNTDVYVVPVVGGQPRRLTYHPAPDVALGWSPDGTRILFSSMRSTPRDVPQLFTVPAIGGQPTPLPLPSGNDAVFSPDGSHLAYSPFDQWQPAWKKYRGGQTARIWIANLADSKVTQIPRTNSNDRSPMWVGDSVYFLSDREGPTTLYACDLKTQAVRKCIPNDRGFDIASASAGPGAIVYHQFGSLRLYDLASGTTRKVNVTIGADFPMTRPHMEKVEPSQVLHAALSPSGKRALFEVRGDLLSVPAEKGDARNLTQSPGVADRDPAFSPDGKWVAWFSDESGEYAMHLRAPDGLGPVKKVNLGSPGSFFYSPRWSPDSRKVAYTDKRMNLWVVDIDHPKPIKVDQDLYDTPLQNLDPAWSSDSRWVAYTKQLPNHLHGAFLYNLEDRKIRQVSDGRSDVRSPRFDRDGKHLFFIASTNNGLANGWLDMSSQGRPVAGNVYAMVLRKDLPSPVVPESDEETAKTDSPKEAKPDDKEKDKKAMEPVRIDFEGLDQRIVALPFARANYSELDMGPEGVLLAQSVPVALADEEALEMEGLLPVTLTRLDLKTRKTEKLADGIDGGSLTCSADGTKMLFSIGKKWAIAPTDKPVKSGEGAVKLEGADLWVDPQAEWNQMYREAWRIERDFLYDPNAHGLDLKKAEKLYAAFLPGLAHRSDLNTLLAEMTGHLSLGHTFIRGGTMPRQTPVSVGLLGADFRVVDGRFQVARILPGENWNPKLQAPLTQPGVNVKEGDFILAVNGQDIRTDREFYAAFLGTAGKQTVLTVADKADGTTSRSVTVVPVENEEALRLRSWMEANRRRVDEATGGKVAYVYIPDTAEGGFANFNRYFYSQVGRQAVILDERFNHGGNIADFIVDQLKKTPQMINLSREGEEVVEPAQAIFGPKVMIINQMSGSGGDALPWLYKKAGIGPLVGTRTWGGLVGIGGYPPLMDGGRITAPRWALYGTKGEWEVENIGIAPDIEVEQNPALMRQGQDPQLEKAIQVVMDLLAKQPLATFKRAPIPDYKPVLPDSAQ